MKKVLHLSPYSVIPPQYGGATRIYNLCREVSQHYQVMHFAQQVTRSNLAWSLSPVVQQVTPTYIEYSCRNPLNILLYGIISSKLKYPFTFHSEVLTLSAPQWLHQQIKEAVIINVEHPWQFSWVYRQIKQQKPILVTAHNVESILCSDEKLIGSTLMAKQVAKDIERRERFAMQNASRVLAMSYQDIKQLVKRYNISPEKCIVIPNGVDCQNFIPTDPTLRKQRKQEFGFIDRCVVMFAGSTHTPNREAVEQIVQWAENWEDERVHFLIVGSIGRTFSHVQRSNITFTGLVEDIRPYFEAADIAINPMLSGSGTNLKQLEYMAMGLPTLATPVGARGIEIIEAHHGYISEIHEFPAKLDWLIQHSEVWDKVGKNARQFVQQVFDWSVIGAKILEVYRNLDHPAN